MSNTITLNGKDQFLFLQSRFNMSKEKAIDFMKENNQDLSWLADEKEGSQKKTDPTRGVKMTPPKDWKKGKK